MKCCECEKEPSCDHDDTMNYPICFKEKVKKIERCNPKKKDHSICTRFKPSKGLDCNYCLRRSVK